MLGFLPYFFLYNHGKVSALLDRQRGRIARFSLAVSEIRIGLGSSLCTNIFRHISQVETIELETHFYIHKFVTPIDEKPFE